jgi:hypothetical protein
MEKEEPLAGATFASGSRCCDHRSSGFPRFSVAAVFGRRALSILATW